MSLTCSGCKICPSPTLPSALLPQYFPRKPYVSPSGARCSPSSSLPLPLFEYAITLRIGQSSLGLLVTYTDPYEQAGLGAFAHTDRRFAPH